MSKKNLQAGVRGMSDVTFPISSPALRIHYARDLEKCPECGGELDTGWECNSCDYDARDLAYPPSWREDKPTCDGDGYIKVKGEIILCDKKGCH